MDNGGRGGDFSGCLSRLACFCCLARSGIWRHVHSSHCQYRSICQTSLCSLHTSWLSPIRFRFSGCIRYAFQRNYHHSAYPRQLTGWKHGLAMCSSDLLGRTRGSRSTRAVPYAATLVLAKAWLRGGTMEIEDLHSAWIRSSWRFVLDANHDAFHNGLPLTLVPFAWSLQL